VGSNPTATALTSRNAGRPLSGSPGVGVHGLSSGLFHRRWAASPTCPRRPLPWLPAARAVPWRSRSDGLVEGGEAVALDGVLTLVDPVRAGRTAARRPAPCAGRTRPARSGLRCFGPAAGGSPPTCPHGGRRTPPGDVGGDLLARRSNPWAGPGEVSRQRASRALRGWVASWSGCRSSRLCSVR
jgi:hypothetical protein